MEEEKKNPELIKLKTRGHYQDPELRRVKIGPTLFEDVDSDEIRSKVVYMRVTPSELRLLKAICRHEKRTIVSLIREIVREGLA